MRRHRADEGQATVELALVLPVIVMLLLLLVQVGVVGDGGERIVEQLLKAQRALPAGTCVLKFTAHAGELEIALSQAGRDWRTSCPVPVR